MNMFHVKYIQIVRKKISLFCNIKCFMRNNIYKTVFQVFFVSDKNVISMGYFLKLS